MSHGGGGGGQGQQSSDPNLTPLLDLVLQLVMFFMLVTNFVSQEMSGAIHLPTASQAKPLTANDTNFMYLNLDQSGKILIPGSQPLLDPKAVEFYMRQTIRNHPLGDKAKDVMTVIIRADKDAKFQDIHKTMVAIKSAGFKRLQLRAEIGK